MKNFTQEKREEINKKISNSLKNNNNKLSKRIAQYNLNGEIIKIYNSISQAATEMNVDRMTISRCCDEKYKNAELPCT